MLALSCAPLMCFRKYSPLSMYDPKKIISRVAGGQNYDLGHVSHTQVGACDQKVVVWGRGVWFPYSFPSVQGGEVGLVMFNATLKCVFLCKYIGPRQSPFFQNERQYFSTVISCDATFYSYFIRRHICMSCCQQTNSHGCCPEQQLMNNKTGTNNPALTNRLDDNDESSV